MLSRVLLGSAAMAAVGAAVQAGGEPVRDGGYAIALVLMVAVCVRAAARWLRIHGPRIAAGALLGYLGGAQAGVAPLPAALVGAVIGYWLVPRRRRRMALAAAMMA